MLLRCYVLPHRVRFHKKLELCSFVLIDHLGHDRSGGDFAPCAVDDFVLRNSPLSKLKMCSGKPQRPERQSSVGTVLSVAYGVAEA